MTPCIDDTLSRGRPTRVGDLGGDARRRPRGVPRCARASCNVIPPLQRDFPSSLGAISTPFGIPGEEVVLRLTPDWLLYRTAEAVGVTNMTQLAAPPMLSATSPVARSETAQVPGVIGDRGSRGIATGNGRTCRRTARCER
jgi:hypothetical protein